MKLANRLLIALVLLCTGSLALADQGRRGNHDQRGQRHAQVDHRQNGHKDNRRSNHDNRRYDNRRYSNQGNQRYGYNQRYAPRPGHRGPPRWVRGHRYSGPTYVVRDYGHHHLRHPPRGYRWVRANNDYLLVAIATGIILDIAMR